MGPTDKPFASWRALALTAGLAAALLALGAASLARAQTTELAPAAVAQTATGDERPR